MRLNGTPCHLEGEVLAEHHRDQQAPVAGRSRDLEPALEATDPVRVPLEVRLRPAQVVKSLQARCQLLIREPVDLCPRLFPALARRVDSPSGRLAQAERRRGRCDQRAITQGTRGRQGVVAHLCRLLEVELIETVDRQLDLQDRRRSRRPIGQIVPGAHQALMRVLMAAEPMLGRRTQRGQLDPALPRVHR